MPKIWYEDSFSTFSRQLLNHQDTVKTTFRQPPKNFQVGPDCGNICEKVEFYFGSDKIGGPIIFGPKEYWVQKLWAHKKISSP